jgi:putative lipoic acid-binding regulatory protein
MGTLGIRFMFLPRQTSRSFPDRVSVGLLASAPKLTIGEHEEPRMSNKIAGTAEEALSQVQTIVTRFVPEAHCELQDYQHRIGCGAPDKNGNIVDVVMIRRELDEEQVEALAQELARKVARDSDQETQDWLNSMEPLNRRPPHVV